MSGATYRTLLIAASLAFVSALDGATISACPTTVSSGASFPPGLAYICHETDNLWLAFQDLGAVTFGQTALPAGTIFHIDPLGPGQLGISVEPGSLNQFAAGSTYSWTYEVVEDSLGNPGFARASSVYGALGTQPTLTTTITALNISSFNPDGTPNTTTGGGLGTLTLANGALQQISFEGVWGVRFTDTLTGIGENTAIQSVSNDVTETPEPLTGLLAGLGLLLVGGWEYGRRGASDVTPGSA